MANRFTDIFGKILQLLVFVALALFIVNLFISIGIETSKLIIILIIVYILYLIAEFCSTTASFLCHKTNENGIKMIMENLVKTPPQIEFYCECYHYETRTVRYNPPKRGGGRKKRKSGRRVKTRHKRVRITTYRETAYFPYYSARDVSGLFQLNKSREVAMGKVYVKLELTPEINFADEVSYMDYEYFRSDFYNRNRPKDQYMDYRETRTVPGLNNFNLVCIRNEEPCGINICMFILFTILPFAEFYKCYINSYCLDQSFKIRKLISTRYDLNQDQYQYLVPSFDVPNQQYAFEPNNYNYINNDYQVNLPTEEEINRASQYKNKIPKYECVSYTSINGQIKVGVVQDDPAYCSLNANDAPPPSCQSIETQTNNNIINMNMNMNGYNNMNNFNSKENLNTNTNMNNNINTYNMNNNMNNNMNQDEDDDSEDDSPGYSPYTGGGV